MVEGEKSVVELIHSNFIIDSIYATSDWINEHQDITKDIPLFESIKTDLERMSFFKSASPVIAVANQAINQIRQKSDWELILDDIKDPGNLGTIVRIADWYGIKNIYCSEETVDVYNPKTISSSMGSFSRVQVIYGDLKHQIQESTKPIYYTLMDGDSLYHVPKTTSGLIVIGGEANGISPELLLLKHNAITIPRTGEAESLNAAIATAIVCDRLMR